MGVLLGTGILLVCCAVSYRNSRRPPELSGEWVGIGGRKISEVLKSVSNSKFGASERGARLTTAATALMAKGLLRFSPNLEQEALYRKEYGGDPVLYLSVYCHKDQVLWPAPEELAERIYHETLHAVVGSKKKSKEEESDAFCAAEEAAAAAVKRPARYPVMRDGVKIWDWVQDAYPQCPADDTYVPVGYTLKQLSARIGRPINK